jgi:hypothetical protein
MNSYIPLTKNVPYSTQFDQTKILTDIIYIKSTKNHGEDRYEKWL